MRTLVTILVAWGMLLSSATKAATYTYTAPNYTTITGSGVSPYTTAMHIAGSFTVASALPANLPVTEIGQAGSNIIQSFSFSDGISTYTQANSYSAVAQVATDASGNITQYSFQFDSPVNTAAVGQPAYNTQFYNFGAPQPLNRGYYGTCTAVFTFNARLFCQTISPSAYSQADSQTAGAWSATASSAFALASSLNPSIVGQSITFTASNAGVGTVTFMDATATLCADVTVVSGNATCTTSDLAAGSHPITATYTSTGGATVVTATASLTQIVNAPVPAGTVSTPALDVWARMLLAVLLAIAAGLFGFAAFRR